MKKEWIIKQCSDDKKSVLEKLLEQRGITKPKDIKEYLRYELASQCMSNFEDFEYENFIDNGRLILDFIERLELNDEDNKNKIIVRVNPMGGLYYEDYEEEK